MTYLLLTMLLLLSAANDINYETAKLDKRIKAVKISEQIAVDGRLTESAWADAPKASDFIQSEPKEGEPSVENTEVRVLYDNQNLYFGVYAYDSGVKNVVISELKKDFGTEASDVFEIVLDTFHDERNGYMFSINAAGAKRDAQMINEGREINANWDGVWNVKTSTTEGGWIAEISVPFRTLKFRESEMQTWGINFHRGLRSNIRNEDSFWSPLPRIYNIQRVSMAGTLEDLEGIRPGSSIRIKPYVSSSLAQNGITKVNKGDGDFGFDAKYGITSGLTWDFTYNTDFSQVEADEQQINLTRFSLFFPEKREFFLENSGIFRFGSGEGGGGGGAVGGRLNQLGNDVFFFSRNIGLSADGQAVPILGGSRLTGRAGTYEIGLLTMQQRAYGATGATNFAVARVKRNIWANSDIGVMMMNKDVNDSPIYNRVVGTDANFRFGQFTTANASIAKSFTPGVDTNNLNTRVALGYEDNNWGVRSSYTNIDDNFINELGYTPRRGIQRWNTNVRANIRPRRLEKWVRQFQPHLVIDYIMDSDGKFDSRHVDYHLPVTFQNGAWIEAGKNPTIEVLDKPFRLNSTTTIPAGAYHGFDWFIAARPDSSRKFQPTGRVGVGPFYGGYKRTYTIGSVWRANYKLNTSVTYTRNNIDLPGDTRVHTDLLTARFNYSFSTAVFLNALIQYNTDLRTWNSNVRFNIIHRPLSDIFLVYQERRNSLTGNMMDRAIIAKMTYMLSR
jgi:hypothetical protein